jgi:hypothetical protein
MPFEEKANETGPLTQTQAPKEPAPPTALNFLIRAKVNSALDPPKVQLGTQQSLLFDARRLWLLGIQSLGERCRTFVMR